jgi:WD40 repeat protein
MAFSPDGLWLAVGFGQASNFIEDEPQKITLFDVENRKEQWTYATSTRVSALAFSLDGKLLAAAGHNGTIQLWDVASWDKIGFWKGPAGAKYASILFLLGGRELAVGCVSGTIDLWDLKTGSLARSLRGHGDCVWVMALSPDRRTLATGSWDHSIKLWDCGTFRELRTLRGHNSWLYALTFSPDGNTLASGGVDGALRFWEAPSMGTVDAELEIPTTPATSR